MQKQTKMINFIDQKFINDLEIAFKKYNIYFTSFFVSYNKNEISSIYTNIKLIKKSGSIKKINLRISNHNSSYEIKENSNRMLIKIKNLHRDLNIARILWTLLGINERRWDIGKKEFFNDYKERGNLWQKKNLDYSLLESIK